MQHSHKAQSPDVNGFIFELQLFATDEEIAAKVAADAQAKADAENEERDRKNADSDLSKLAIPELVDQIKHLRAQSANYRNRAKVSEGKVKEYETKFEEINTAKLTEEKKFAELAEKREAERQSAIKERDEAIKMANQTKVFGEVRDAAREAGLKNAKILKTLDMSAIAIGDDGTIDSGELKKFVRELKSEYPELFVDPEVEKQRLADEAKAKADASKTDADKARDAAAQKLADEQKATAEREAAKKAADDEERRKRAPKDSNGNPIDWSRLTPAEFAAEEKRMFPALRR